MAGREFLQTPGPTNIPDDVLEALRRPAIDFGSDEFIAFIESIFVDLGTVFESSGEIFTFVSTGHGAWEAAFANVTSRGDKVLALVPGLFSNAWATMADALGLEVDRIETDWRRAVPIEAVVERLEADETQQIKLITVCHTETAIGVSADLAELAAAIRATGHPALLAVDAIASLGCEPLRTDELGIDIVIGASQKGLMSVPGLGFIAAGERALAAAASEPRPVSYWSWADRLAGVGYRKFSGTPPEHQLFALRVSLDRILEEGLANVHARHARFAKATQAAVEAWASPGGLEFNAVHPEQRAASVTCVRVGEGVDPDAIVLDASNRLGVTMGRGIGDLAGHAFRIGHLGDLNEPMLIGALGGVELALAAQGVPYKAGGVSAAVEYLAATQ